MTGKLIRDTSTDENRAWWDGVLKAAERARQDENTTAESVHGGSNVVQDAGVSDEQKPKERNR